MLHRSTDRSLRALLLLLFVLSGLAGCDQRAEPTRPPETVAKQQKPVEVAPARAGSTDLAFENPFLWTADHPDVDHQSYLFGTVHAGFDVQWMTLPPAVRDAFSASELVVLEAKLDATAGRKLAPLMMLEEDQSLKSGLGEEKFAYVVEVTGVPAASLDRFRPWVVHSMLTEKWTEGRKPMDLKLLTFAEARELELDYLETVQEQAEMLNETITMTVLAETLEEPEAQKKALDEAIAAYRVGDQKRLTTAAFHDELPKEMIDAMFAARNERWSPQIDAHFRNKPTFVGAGAGHFIGPDNVIEDLEALGWTIERVGESDDTD